MLTCPLAPRRNHTTLESHNTMSKCSHLCQHERGYQIRPATLTSPSIFLQNLIPAWIAEDGFPPTIWQMLLPSSRTTRCRNAVIFVSMNVVIKSDQRP